MPSTSQEITMKIIFRSYNANLDTQTLRAQTEAMRDEIDNPAVPSFDCRSRTYVTAWSGYTYKLDVRCEDYGIWEYTGPVGGFMAQHFLPDFGGWEVISASGSFGSFEGADAHQQYKAAKAASGWDSWYRENSHYSDFADLRQQWIANHETRSRRSAGREVMSAIDAIASLWEKSFDRALYGAR